jgi:hypothetical protein
MTTREHILFASNCLTAAENNLNEVDGATPKDKFKLQKTALNALSTARQEVFNAQAALEAEIFKG